MVFSSKYFTLHELVPRDTFEWWGEKSMQFIDPRMVEFMDGIREYFGKSITINNWNTGGNFSMRGFRPPTTTVGGKLSQHRFGRAADFNINDITVKEVYDTIREHENLFMEMGITTMEDIEDTPGWIHADCRWTGLDEILIVKPLATAL